MWNMGILFLIYYCVTVYSAKNGDESAPLSEPGNAENQHEEVLAKSGEEIDETIVGDTTQVSIHSDEASIPPFLNSDSPDIPAHVHKHCGHTFGAQICSSYMASKTRKLYPSSN